DTFGGITLQSDGTVQFLAYDAPLFRPRGPASYEGDPEQPPILPSQWSVSPDGRLLSKSEVDFPAEGFLVSIEGASQDGSLLAGLHTSETSDVILNGKTVVWQRETNELIPVAPSLEKSFLIVRGMSNEGDVIFWVDVDGVTRSFVKDPTGVVHDLPSVH